MRTVVSSWTLPFAASVVCLALGFSACPDQSPEVARRAPSDAGATTEDAGTKTTDDAGTVGQPPHLKVTPDPVLYFPEETASVSTLPLEICNVPDPVNPTAPSGDLVIHAVTLQQPSSSWFALLNPPASDAIVPSGDCITLDVQVTRSGAGGIQTGVLTIETNDPDFGAPGYKRISLFSQSSTRLTPVAVCLGPNGEGPHLAYDLASLNPKRITICGNGSYAPPLGPSDPVPRGIERWKFTLTTAPVGSSGMITQLNTNGAGANVSGTSLTDSSCDGIAGDGCCVDLDVDPVMLGEYRISCVVYDFAGQQSGNIAEMRIVMK